MIEIFRTTVSDRYYANLLVACIHRTFPQYRANFDLSDIDRILRIATNGAVNKAEISRIVALLGYKAELLEDARENHIS